MKKPQDNNHAGRQRPRDFYADVFDQIPTPIWRSGVDRKYNYFNRAWLDFTGHSLEDELGDRWIESVHPDDREHGQKIYHEAFDLRRSFEVEYRLLSRAGNYHWVRDIAKPFYQPNKDFAGYTGYCFDITVSKQAEELLKTSERYFRSLIEHSSDIVSTYDANGIRLYSSPAIERVLGYAPQELIGQSGFDLLHEDDRQKLSNLFSRAVRVPGIKVTREYRCRHKDGSWRTLESTAVNLLHEPAVATIVLNSRDITERRRLDRELQRSEDQFRSFMNNLPGNAWMKDAEGRYVYVNAHLQSVLPDYQRNWLGKTDEDFWPGEIAAQYRLSDQRVASERRPLQTIANWPTSGRLHSMLVNKFPIFNERGEVSMIGGFAIDITQQVETEAALNEAERKYREIFENATEGIFQTTPEGKFITANPALARMLGFDSPEELIRTRTDIAREHYVDSQRREEFKRLLDEQGTVTNFEIEAYRKDGSRIWTTDSVRAVRDQNGKVLYYEGISQDITERKRAEATSLAFATLARKLSGARTQRDAGRIIAGIAQELFGWDACNFALYDSERDLILPMLNLDTIRGVVTTVAASPVMKLTARARRVLEHGSELLLREEPIHFDEDVIPFGDTSRPSASLITVPVRHADRVVGILSIQSYTPKAYDYAALRDLEALAEHCGEAVNRISAEEQLRESEERFRQLAENVDDVIWIADRTISRLLYINPAYERVFGLSCESIYEQWNSFLEAVHPDDRKDLERMLEQQAAGNYAPFEYRIVRPDGAIRWILRRTFPILNGQGEIYRVAGIGQDITERKRAEQSLSHLRRELQLTMDSMGEGVYQIDREGKIVFDNRAAARMLGWEIADLIGRPAHLTKHHTRADGSQYPEVECPIYATLRDGLSRHVTDEVFWRQDGTSFPVEHRSE